jgi:hypothetical protein
MLTARVMEELAPQRQKMSYEEYLEFASESKILEWVEGEVLIYVPPIEKHQRLSLFLGGCLSHSFNTLNWVLLFSLPSKNCRLKLKRLIRPCTILVISKS